jgi:hypothetical protein
VTLPTSPNAARQLYEAQKAAQRRCLDDGIERVISLNRDALIKTDGSLPVCALHARPAYICEMEARAKGVLPDGCGVRVVDRKCKRESEMSEDERVGVYAHWPFGLHRELAPPSAAGTPGRGST